MRYNKYLIIILLIVAAFYAFKCARTGHDFEVFVFAGHKIIHGANIYKPPFVQNLQYYYSPLFALLLAPFSGLPTIVPQFLWICLSYFLLFRIWKLCGEYFNTSKLTQRQQRLWLMCSAILSLRFILYDIGYVQMTIFLLWGTLESLQLIKKGRNFEGASLLAFAINVKLLPLAFIFYLIYRNKLKAAVFTCLFYVLYLYIPTLYLGWDENILLIKEWFAVINPGNKEWTIEADNGPSSLVALVPVYITHTVGVLPFKRNFLDLTFSEVSIILNSIRLVLVTFTLFFLGTRPFKRLTSNVRVFWELSYIFIAIPLIYPHQQQYAFVFLIPAFVYLSWYFIVNWSLIKQKMNPFAWCILFLIGINFTPIIGRDVISGYAVSILLYYRILTIAVILLIPVLWICKPRNETSKETTVK